MDGHLDVGSAAAASPNSRPGSVSPVARGQSPLAPGFRVVNVQTVEFHIPADYEYMEYLSGGSYGNVIKVQHADGTMYAIKKMYDPFGNKIKARRVYRELKLLELMDHENVIRFAGIYTPDRDYRRFRNVYIVTQYAGKSLRYALDKQREENKRLIKQEHIKYIIYQLLRALKYLHSANVIHRDLKPSNLAITEECDLTVLDFGMARTLHTNSDELTDYVISRWYRSPEVIFWNNVSYTQKVDVWSVGCILAELLTNRVLFPGSEAMEQYRLITNLCGSPSEELMAKIERLTNSNMRALFHLLGGQCERKDFREVFRALPADAVDLLDKLLRLDPDQRISVEEALQHPYVHEYYCPEDEPVAESPFDIDDNDSSRPLEFWKEAVWREIQRLNAEPANFASSAVNPLPPAHAAADANPTNQPENHHGVEMQGGDGEEMDATPTQ